MSLTKHTSLNSLRDGGQEKFDQINCDKDIQEVVRTGLEQEVIYREKGNILV